MLSHANLFVTELHTILIFTHIFQNIFHLPIGLQYQLTQVMVKSLVYGYLQAA